MYRAIYKDNQKTRGGREIVTMECNCLIARKERARGKRVHKAFKYAYEYYDPTDLTNWYCSISNTSVTL